MYRIAIIGANGGVGRQCVEIALKEGHAVTAILRTPSKLSLTHPRLQIVKGDIREPATLLPYLRDADAVISAVGTSGGLFGDKPTTLYSTTAATILAAAPLARTFFISAVCHRDQSRQPAGCSLLCEIYHPEAAQTFL